MHDPSFLTGLELGKFLARLKRVEEDISAVRADLNAHIGKMRRAVILVTLWTLAALANASSDTAAEFAVEMVLSALKR